MGRDRIGTHEDLVDLLHHGTDRAVYYEGRIDTCGCQIVDSQYPLPPGAGLRGEDAYVLPLPVRLLDHSRGDTAVAMGQDCVPILYALGTDAGYYLHGFQGPFDEIIRIRYQDLACLVHRSGIADPFQRGMDTVP